MNLDRLYQRQAKEIIPVGYQFKPTKGTVDSLTTSALRRNEPKDSLQGLLAAQVEASKSIEGLHVRVLQAQKLYMASLESSGKESRATVNHGLRLGNMLEKDGMTSHAIQWYKTMICDGERVDQDATSPVRHYELIQRLAHLHELEPADLAVAELFYIQNWNALKNRTGGEVGDALSLRAFRDLWRFYVRHPTMSEKAIGLLDNTWAELQNEGRANQHFFMAVEAPIHSYASIGRHETSKELSRQAVAFLPSGELTSHSIDFLARSLRKLGTEYRLEILRLHLEHQVSLGATDISMIATTARDLFNSSNSGEPLNESDLLLLQTAYNVWKPLGADHMTYRVLGELLVRELEKGKKVEERRAVVEKRWKHCLETLGPFHHATVEASKALGKQDVLEIIWDAHKERYGTSDPVTLKLGEDLANSSENKELTIKMYRELFNLSWASTALGPSHDLTIRLGTTLVLKVCGDDDKEPEVLHNRMFQGLRQAGSTDASGLSRYKKLARSCSLQFRHGVGEQPTDQSREIISFAIGLSRKLDGPFAPGTIELLGDYVSCTENIHGNDALDIYKDLWSDRDAQVVWHDRNISKVGRELAGLYFKAGRRVEAVEFISDVCQHDEGEYDLPDQCTLKSYDMLSHIYFEQRDYRSALRLHEEILAKFRKHNREAYFDDMVRHFHMKGRALQQLGLWMEARGILDEAFDMARRVRGPHSYRFRKLDNIKWWLKREFKDFA